jgi:protein AroM
MTSDRFGVRVGLLTIGQAPRHDSLAQEVGAILGAGVDAVQRGALDGLDREQVDALRITSGGSFPLATQMTDGRPVVVDEIAITHLLNKQIRGLESQDAVEATLLMCTGSFPQLDHGRPLLQPHAALFRAAAGIAGDHHLSSLTPLAAQVEHSRQSWRRAGMTDVGLLVADPYGPDPFGAVMAAASAARIRGSKFLYMDCFGYDLAMKEAARRAFEGPVVLARSLAARLFPEIIA